MRKVDQGSSNWVALVVAALFALALAIGANGAIFSIPRAELFNAQSYSSPVQNTCAEEHSDEQADWEFEMGVFNNTAVRKIPGAKHLIKSLAN